LIIIPDGESEMRFRTWDRLSKGKKGKTDKNECIFFHVRNFKIFE